MAIDVNNSTALHSIPLTRMVAFLHFRPAVGILGTLRLPWEPQGSEQMGPHTMGAGSRFNGECMLNAGMGRGLTVIRRTKRGWSRVVWTGPISINSKVKTEGPHHSGGFSLPYGASVYTFRITSSEPQLRESVGLFRAWRFPDDPWPGRSWC